MRVLLKSASGLLLFEALLALLLLSGVAVGLLTLQGRVLATAQAAHVRALVTAESAALVQGMRANAGRQGNQPHWRHYQRQALGGCDVAVPPAVAVGAEALALRQLCRFQQGISQLLPATDFAYVVCAYATPLAATQLPSTGPLRLSCPQAATVDAAESWVLLLAWRIQQTVYVSGLRLSDV